ncbi:MAG: acyl-CoA dehydrogenase [Acidobacteriota bacterium]
MRIDYTEDQQLLLQMVREFAKSEIAPGVRERERGSIFPEEILRRMGELGLLGMIVPEEYGGAGTDTVTYCLAIEEIARVCPSSAVTMSVNNSVCCYPILAYGSEEQRKRYLPRLATGETLGAFCLTEPHCGSDATAIRTRAVRDGDSYVLNGTKAWVTNGGAASVYIVAAVTDPAQAGRGISAFIVESSFPGFRIGTIEDKMGLRASRTTEVILEDCRVPAENLLSVEGMGIRIALSALDGARIGVAAQAVGIAQGAFDAALQYSKQRTAFGKTLAEIEAVRNMFADMYAQIQAARMLTHRAAALRDKAVPFSKESSMAKLYASEMCNRVTGTCVQIHGAYGFSREFAAERYYRDARVTTIYEGTSEIQRVVIARNLLKGA